MKYTKWALCLLMIALLTLLPAADGSRAAVPVNLIRLHVLASSDEPADQVLKNQVRDQIIVQYGSLFGGAQSAQEAGRLIEAMIPMIEDTAGEEIQIRGYDYPVEAQFGVFDFPVRMYGDNIYPAGRYQALRLVIGEGSGANWWCVMFPPLCFVDISSGVARQQAETGEPSKPAAVSSGAADTSETIYTFKLAEWWQRIRQSVASLFRSRR